MHVDNAHRAAKKQMDFDLSEEQRMLQGTVEKLMTRVATADYVRRIDREKDYPHALYDAWADAGLLAVPFPEEYGGAAGSILDLAVVCEVLGRTSADFVMAYAGSVFCGLNILRNGSEAQKHNLLPRLIGGDIKMSISISEPAAGSDVGAIRSSARRDGDDWIVDGLKVWQTGAAADGNIINAYVRTDPDAHYRNGLSMLLIPNDTPGVEIRKLDMLGRYCVGIYEIVFNNVRVPADSLVGGENNGWTVLLSGLQAERAVIAACDCGSASAVVQQALDYAKEREQFGQPIGSFQAIAHMLADMHTEVETARTMMWRAAWMVSAGRDALQEITMAKLVATETYAKVANMGMQIMGANGYSMDYDMQRHYRDARISTVGGGSSQIMRNLIAGQLGLKVR